MKKSQTIQEIKEAYKDVIIAELFRNYVTCMEDKPRHTAKAILEADVFDQFCEGKFPNNRELQIDLYDRMMNAAVEFEESGFIAGFKTALKILDNAVLIGNREVA